MDMFLTKALDFARESKDLMRLEQDTLDVEIEEKVKIIQNLKGAFDDVDKGMKYAISLMPVNAILYFGAKVANNYLKKFELDSENLIHKSFDLKYNLTEKLQQTSDLSAKIVWVQQFIVDLKDLQCCINDTLFKGASAERIRAGDECWVYWYS